MDLLTPQIGLIFWTTVVFLGLLFLLRKFAWRPILSSLKTREESIQEALDAADRAKEEMAQLKADNEKLLAEARMERDKIIKEATNASNRMKEEAKSEASAQTERMIENARKSIETEKKKALEDVKTQVAVFSLEIAERILRENLSGEKKQEQLVDKYLDDLNLN